MQTKRKRSNRKTDITLIIAIVGASGLVIAAIVTGIFDYKSNRLIADANATAAEFNRVLTAESLTKAVSNLPSTPSYSSNIRLIPISGKFITVTVNNHPLDLGGIIPINETITVTFRVLNNGSAPALIRTIVIGARGPGVSCNDSTDVKWSGRDNPFPTATNIVLQPGEEFEYLGGRKFFLPGKYFLETNIQGPNGDWGGIEPFTCIDLVVKK